MAAKFKIGDRVAWNRAVSEEQFQGAIGVILAIVPGNSDAFALFDVEFDFGLFTLYGTQIDVVPADPSPTIEQPAHVSIKRAVGFFLSGTELEDWEQQHLFRCGECHAAALAAAKEVEPEQD